jgi:hypothetical protein
MVEKVTNEEIHW